MGIYEAEETSEKAELHELIFLLVIFFIVSCMS